MSYYNTNKEKGDELKDSQSKAKTQEDLILEIFQRKESLTASQAWFIFKTTNAPLTSIRRAITTLCREDKYGNPAKLIRTDTMRVGIYGKQEHVYKLNSNQLSIFDL